jgi:UDP-N-acetylmuramoylalanine-D-glutamate ligase
VVLSQLDKVTALVQGGCATWETALQEWVGADYLAKEWAELNEIPVHEHPADWKKHGKGAGPIRNQEMLDQHADLAMVVAFPGGKGTEDMVKRAKAKSVPVWEVK